MMYIVRLTNGDCVVVLAADDSNARAIALKLSLDETVEVASVRPLDHFAVLFSPKEDGSLEAAHWDDATLESILANEYPLLSEAYRRANAEPLLPISNSGEAAMPQLQAAYERNVDLIRQGVEREMQRHIQPALLSKSKAAQSR